MLWERSTATAAIAESVAGAEAGAGQALFIVAEAGLGKTSLLAEARRLAAEASFEVAAAQGGEMERVLPFGLASQAFAALRGSGFDGDEILRAREPAPFAPFLRLIRALGRRQGPPLLLALDDLQWADPDSLRLFAFLAHRIAAHRVALVGTMRPWPADAEAVAADVCAAGRGRLLRLRPLSPVASVALLRARSTRDVSDEAAERAWELCRGNPHLIEQVALALDRGEEVPRIEGDARGFSAHMALARFAGLDEPAMACARAACVQGTAHQPELAAEVAGITGSQRARSLEALFRSGLMVEDDGEIRFAHPLFAAALYDDIPLPERRRLHARTFELLAERGMFSEAGGHAVRAELVGEPRAIDACERAGAAALAAGAVASAVSHLEAAVSLAGDEPSLGLLLKLARALSACGRMGEVAAVCRSILRRSELGWHERVETLRILGRAEYLTGGADHGAAVIDEAIEIALAHDPQAAVQALLDKSLTAWLDTGPAAALPVAARAREIAAAGADRTARERAGAAFGHIAFEHGQAAGLDATDEIGRRLRTAAGEALFDPVELAWPWAAVYNYAQNEVAAERYEAAELTLGRAREVAEQAGAADALATTLIYLASLNIRRGRLEQALADAVRAVEFAELTPGVVPYAAIVRSEALLWLGRLDEAERWRDEGQRGAPGQWFAELWAAHIEGLRLLWAGDVRASDALLRVEEISLGAGVNEPCHLHWGANAVAAHLAAGRPEDAGRVVAWHAERARALPCRWPRIVAALGGALIAAGEGADDAAAGGFEEALRLHDEVELPLLRSGALLAYGSFLRRSGRPGEARPRLAQAARLAEGCGAMAVSARALEELHIAGGRRRAAGEDPDALTAAELRVARLAADGLTNAEIARSLQLSPNTVATHLKRTYSKLGIRSRRELRDVELRAQPRAGEPAGP